MMQAQQAIDPSRAALQAVEAGRATEAARLGAAGHGAEAGRAVETLFATMLVKEMRSALPGGFFSGPGSDVFSAWFDEHIGRTLAERDALGLSRLVRSAVERAPGEGEEPAEEAR